MHFITLLTTVSILNGAIKQPITWEAPPCAANKIAVVNRAVLDPSACGIFLTNTAVTCLIYDMHILF